MPAAAVLMVVAPVWLALAVVAYGGPRSPPGVTGAVTLLAFLCLRPALVGEVLGPAGAILLAATLLLALWRHIGSAGPPPGRQAWALGACLVAPLIIGGGISVSALSGLLITPVVAAAGWAVARDRRVLSGFMQATLIVALHQAVAMTVTQTLSFDSWTYTVAETGDRAGANYEISRLGSVSSGSGGVIKIFESRLTGPFGEPGLFAAFLAIVGVVHLVTTREWQWRAQAPLIAAVVLTQSIAGMGAYAAGVVVFVMIARTQRRGREFRLRHALVVAAAGYGSLWAATQNDEALTIKRESNAVSVSDRLTGVSPSQLLGSWTSNPLGDGVSSSINLVQSSLTYGPSILAFGLWFYLAPLRGRNPWTAVPIVAALLLTVVFSQPPFLYPWVFFALVASAVSVPGATSQRSRPHPVDQFTGASRTWS